jgi:[protein-PII] uridylyltransferase
MSAVTVPVPEAAPADAPGLRTAYRARRAELFDRFRARHDVAELVRETTRETDRLLLALWRPSGLDARCCLIAVGGYGRGEQLPHSDVDILLLVPEAADGLAGHIEAFIGSCWDAGMEIGHSVRSVDQCIAEAAADITVQTSLLERRFLAGRRALYRQLSAPLEAAADPVAFMRAKRSELRQRHAKYDDTPYNLEPNVKESPGGLRDLQTVLWIARAAGLGRTWRQLAERGIVTRSEAAVLARYARHLKLLRAWLHLIANRREDRLVFDLQAQVARAQGHAVGDARQASEHLMQRYYWTAKAVTQLTTILLQNLEAALAPVEATSPEPLDAEFSDDRGLLDVVDETLFERDPGAILRAFIAMQRHAGRLTGMSARTLRAIWRARTRIDAAFRRDPRNQALFMQILQAPRGVTRELRRMNQWSVLGRYLPAFRRIVGRMQHDLFHVYTVDQHILMVVRNLRRFATAEHAHEFPFCSQLISGFDKPWLLTVAALFHDIAKGRGGDHSELGRLDARRFCRSHGLDKGDCELVEFLVEHHLTMSSVAQKQDLSDPEVVQRFARLAGDERRLTALYLLTVADIRGTSPKVWNAWKGKLLEDLYRAAMRVLGGEQASADERLDARRAEAVRLLNLYGVSSERYASFWSLLDIGYFLRNEPQDIAWQTRVLHGHAGSATPVVRTRLASVGVGFQVVTYLPDQQDLFARICGYFDSQNLSILDARVHTTRHGYALDSFLVVDPAGSGSYRDILALVETELAARLSQRRPLDPPVRGRASRRSRYFPVRPQVDLRPDARGNRYLLSITANDRTGLLYGIARTLASHGVNLLTARITTLGERAEDVFLVDGSALANARKQIQLEQDLLAVVQA